MNQEELNKVLDNYLNSAADNSNTDEANFSIRIFDSDLDFSFRYLKNIDFSECRIRNSNFSDSNLQNSKFNFSILNDSNFKNALMNKSNLNNVNARSNNFSEASFEYASLSGSIFDNSSFVGVNFVHAGLSGSKFYNADFTGANFINANLSNAHFRNANFSNAKFIKTILSSADFSGAHGLIDPITWMKENFKTDEYGYIVYKGIGNTDYSAPKYWNIKPGSFIEETVNPDRTTECGCGINFGTKEFIKSMFSPKQLWKCRIRWEDLPGLVVPFVSNGKARCSRLELVEVIESIDEYDE